MSRIAVLGTGLIGGSLGMAARAAGHVVVGFDADADRARRAEELGALDEVAASAEAASAGSDVAVVAVPVDRIAGLAEAALDAGAGAVTDVGSVKRSIVEALEAGRPDAASRFVGGHPMAGSEQDGLDGADADLFTGATWVLTPTAATAPDAFRAVRALVADLGAEVVAIRPDDHDTLVAVVSHVPQLAATTLMDMAARRGEEHAPLLRLAAGGFRDMTRIAASNPDIWPGICVANRAAIVAALDDYVAALTRARALVAEGDGASLRTLLERARAARRSLPVGATGAGPLAELRVPVPDRPGVLAEVTTLAGSLGVNIFDIETVHSSEGDRGVLVLAVAVADAPGLEEALTARGYHHSRSELE